MLECIHQNSSITLGICCPIQNIDRMKDGILEGEPYYSFQALWSEEELNCNQEERFIEIIKEFEPDIIHIWGTEYMHTYNMLCAAEKMNMLDKTIVSIQGLISSVVQHYCDGIEREERGIVNQIEELTLQDRIRSKYEIKAIKKCVHITGRTEWDKACSILINPNITYWHIGESLRDIFYEESSQWRVEKCRRHSIFLSHVYCSIKGLHYFLNAFQYVLQKYPDATVRIAGNNIMELNDAYGRYIRNRALKLNIKDKLLFLGKLSEAQMCQEYKMANVFVCSSTVENSSNSICEAMLIGTPTIGSFVGGIPSLITHRRDGFLYQCNEPEMLAYYIEKIFEDDMLATELSKNAALSISSKVDRQKNGDALLELYNRILIT